MRKFIFKTLFATFVFTACFVISQAVYAQSRELESVSQKIERLERDINTLQRYLYKGDAPSAGAVPAPAPQESPTVAANTAVRIQELETELRTLTGQLEEINHSIRTLQESLTKLSSDVDMRLQTLEKGGQSASASPKGEAQTDQQVMAGSDQKKTYPIADDEEKPSGVGKPGSARAQYERAFALLQQADFDQAEKELKAFMRDYPDDPLAANAQYWLGETYYVRKDYENAAVQFLEGYEKYPKSPKGADSLLKLGLSLTKLGNSTEACSTFAQLAKDYPDASANIKRRAEIEKKRLSCK